jgi:hypothetical protein
MPVWQSILVFGWAGLTVGVVAGLFVPGFTPTTNTYLFWTLAYIGIGVLALVAKKKGWK